MIEAMMKKINDLDELIQLIGKETVDKCFVEYMMIMIAKKNKFDELEDSLKNEKDSRVFTVEELKKILN